ncbi:MAG: Fur family transcriptional regulator [Pseudomonadota bacterium]
MKGIMRKQGVETQAEVLAVLERHGKPMTAYEILNEMREANARLAAPTIYRALAALTGDGRAHRVESINAYLPCCHEGHGDGAVLAICDDCGGVEEQVDTAIIDRVADVAGSNGFQAKRHVIEVHGTCGECAGKAE